MKPYPRYKDSGVEWIGEVPEGWDIIKIKYLIKDHSGNGFPHREQGNRTGEIPFLKVSDVSINERYIESSNNYVSEYTVQKYKWNLVPVNSIVTAKIGESLRKNHRKVLLKECVIDNNCIGIEPKRLNKGFNFYLHSTIDFDWFVNPGAVPSLSVEKYKSHFCAIPSHSEQTAIAAFLDRKTAEIDTLIANKERLIELYEEEKKAVINQAVTKGLDPDAEMKDSGVEWLGEIPAHWEVRRLGQLSRVVRGASPRPAGSPEYFDGNHTPWITVGEITKDDKKYLLSTSNYLTEKGRKQSRYIEAETLLLSNSGATLGVPKITKIGGCINDGSVAFLDTEDILIDFVYFFLKSLTVHLRELVKVSGQPNLNTDIVKGIQIAILDCKEQTTIVHHIETQCNRIDAIINKLKKQINLFKEYRTALISEAVTGKIQIK